MKKDWGDYIADILNAIEEVEEFRRQGWKIQMVWMK